MLSYACCAMQTQMRMLCGPKLIASISINVEHDWVFVEITYISKRALKIKVKRWPFAQLPESPKNNYDTMTPNPLASCDGDVEKVPVFVCYQRKHQSVNHNTGVAH